MESRIGRYLPRTMLATAGLLLAALPAVAQTSQRQVPVPSGQVNRPAARQYPIQQPGGTRSVVQRPGDTQSPRPSGQPMQRVYPRNQTPVRPGPNQPVIPARPTIEKRPTVTLPPRAPFRLTPQQEADLNRVLVAWEKRSNEIKTFKSSFTRWTFSDAFRNPKNPDGALAVDEGRVIYARPDRGLFEVGGDRPEKWICDGKSMIQYDYDEKTVTHHAIPKHLQGEAIKNGPLPFLFGSKANELKQRYFLRLMTNAEDRKNNRICLEALPRFQQDAANFSKAELLLRWKGKKLELYAIQVHQPGGGEREVYQFHGIVINDPLFIVQRPFAASTPRGWTKHVKAAPVQQVSRPPVVGPRPAIFNRK